MIYNLICAIFIIAAVITAKANDTEPNISIYQGSEKGISILVIEWPDGIVEKLKYKDSDVDSERQYLPWFKERYDKYDKRAVK